jgi:hypothetical protein
MTGFSKTAPALFISTLVCLLCGCVYTSSGDIRFNRDIEIVAASGAVAIDVSGHISKKIYLRDDVLRTDKEKKLSPIEPLIPRMPVVEQGNETIRKTIILYETEKFKYTLTPSEALVLNARSIDGNDAKLIVFEYGRSEEHLIDGKNRFGRMLSFKN